MNGVIDKIMYFLDNVYNEHIINGATLFGVALALYGILKIPQLTIDTTTLFRAMVFFFILAIYEILIKGTIVYLYKKGKSKS